MQVQKHKREASVNWTQKYFHEKVLVNTSTNAHSHVLQYPPIVNKYAFMYILYPIDIM